jgi:hypothetical protein
MSQWLSEAKAIDTAIYGAIAASDTPGLDSAMRRLSHAADHGKLWAAIATALALLGGPGGRLAAPLRILAMLVGYSRVHTGVHYPADVLAGARAWGIPGYTGCMAKVMVSLPDDLLAEVDAEARRGGTTRSAVMREFADAALRRRRASRATAMRSLLSDTSPHGGNAAERVKATRPGP